VLAVVILAVVFTGALVPAAVAAPFQSRRRPLRVAAFGVTYCVLELCVITWAGVLWLRHPSARHFRAGAEEHWVQSHEALLAWALARILGAARRYFDFQLEVQGAPDPATLDPDDPTLVLARHAGPGDSFALLHLLASGYRRRVKVVMKETLQLDPAIDLVLNRLGCCFLPPASSAGTEPLNRIGRMARSLAPREALLLFPEGGNWTPERRWRAIRRLRRRREEPRSRAAVLMTNVLPPRFGGVLACLDARPELQVLIAAHAGLDRVTSVRQAWEALPVRRRMTVRIWPAAEAPENREDRKAWLLTEWAVLDEWVDRHHAHGSGESGALEMPPAK
jgi:1-acyl-sn-glycerol-3-phosphate acyltransferase